MPSMEACPFEFNASKPVLMWTNFTCFATLAPFLSFPHSPPWECVTRINRHVSLISSPPRLDSTQQWQQFPMVLNAVARHTCEQWANICKTSRKIELCLGRGPCLLVMVSLLVLQLSVHLPLLSSSAALRNRKLVTRNKYFCFITKLDTRGTVARLLPESLASYAWREREGVRDCCCCCKDVWWLINGNIFVVSIFWLQSSYSSDCL